jgi:hypothetical protein
MITVVPDLAGTPSDDLADVLAIGRSDVTFFSVNMSARHPEGRDADFLRWHTFDHRPEHARVAGLRGSMRVVSTPKCRAARAASHGRYDAVDHVMTYLFSAVEAVDSGVALSKALGRAGRMPFSLPPIERGDYQVDGMKAAARIKIGADVLPWWPARGLYIIIERIDRGGAPAGELADIPGVGGTWWGSSEIESEASGAAPLQVTYCFLDDDPVATAKRLSPALEKRWADSGVEPRLAAPFYPVVGFDCDRYLP